MRKVFLDDLPRWGKGINNGNINWKNSIGFNINFICDNINGEILIIDYCIKHKDREPYVKIKYCNNEIWIARTNLIKCKLGELLKQSSKHKYNIGDILSTNTGQIQIIDQIRMKNGKSKVNQKGYVYKCLIDNNIDQMFEYILTQGGGCNVCRGFKILKGYNDLWTTHSYIAELLKDKSRGYEISFGRGSKEIFVCPRCNNEKPQKVANVFHQGFSCPVCGDGVSYPNKFGRNFLKQLNNIYSFDCLEYEYSPDWIKPKRYDNYFEYNSKKYIIEMDGGLGHGKYNPLNGQTSEESTEVDNYKDKLANLHKIKVIRIDCIKSNMEYIKNNLIDSELFQLFDLSKINWNECNEFACNNFIEIVAKHWTNGIKNTKYIGEIMGLSSTTIVRYLKQGTELGWCDYNSKISRKESGIFVGNIPGEKLRINVIQLSLNNEYIKRWDSMTKAGKELNISQSSISNCCTNKKKSGGGFKWKYTSEYIKSNPLPTAV